MKQVILVMALIFGTVFYVGYEMSRFSVNLTKVMVSSLR